MTIVTPRTDQLSNPIADNAIAIAAGAEKMIGPFPSEHYGAAADGLGDITYSGVTSLTVGIFAFTRP